MVIMKKLLSLIALFALSAGAASAQTEADLKRFFEGKQVVLKIDMPATKDGVNVYPGRPQTMNYSEYANRLKRSGTSIRAGDSVMITKVKINGKHIELQLGGGGYGTVGDETDTGVNISPSAKSKREKNLEEEIKRETDPDKRKRMKQEVDDLRRRREREDRRNEAIAADAAEAKRARIEQKALSGGSRFNIQYETKVDPGVTTPDTVIDALKKFLEFSGGTDEPEAYYRPGVSFRRGRGAVARPGVINVGPKTTFLRNGLTAQEVVRLLGEPMRVSERRRGETRLSTYVFSRAGGRVLVAEFENDVLLNSRVEDRDGLASL
jgi:hypothetical protein